MKIILVCGYRGTGKDTLFRHLHGSESKYRWTIYCDPSNYESWWYESSYARVAFADALKQEVADKYHIPMVVSDKNLPQFIHPSTSELVSARDLYIEWAAIRRSQDPDYWVKVVRKQLVQDTCYIITDWRYMNEQVQLPASAMTARVYRQSVEEPAMDIISEHGLDNVKTDYLILDEHTSLGSAIRRFPQYYGYVPVDIM